MTIVLGPTWAYEQRDKLLTLQWSGLWDVISLQTLCWEIGGDSRSWNKLKLLQFGGSKNRLSSKLYKRFVSNETCSCIMPLPSYGQQRLFRFHYVLCPHRHFFTSHECWTDCDEVWGGNHYHQQMNSLGEIVPGTTEQNMTENANWHQDIRRQIIAWPWIAG